MDIVVSIVIPCYNSEKFIDKTIESIANQDFKDIEVIIVDDGSTDNSINISKSLLSNHNLNFNIINQKNKGVSAARNAGIELARGKYIYFIDSDDIIDSRFINKMINKIEKNKTDFIFCGFDKVDKNFNLISKYSRRFKYINGIKSGTFVLKMMLKEKIYISIGTGIYKKEILNNHKIRFTERCYNGEDQEFIYKVLFNCSSVCCIKESLFKYVQRNTSFLHTYSIKKLSVLGSIMRIKKYFIENGAEEKLVEYISKNKLQKEFIRNMNSMSKYITDDKSLSYIAKNRKFNLIISQFKPITLTKYEFLFWIRWKLYLYKYNN